MRNVLILVAIGSTMGWAADRFQPLNVKTGQWETTTQVRSGGQLAMPADYMEKLTPEQRAQVESAMKEASAPKTTTRTSQDCLTKEDLDRGSVFNPNNQQCTQKVLSSTSDKLSVEEDCKENSMTTKTLLSLEAVSPELVKGTGTVAVTSGGHTFTSNLTFTSRWTSASCSNKK